MGIMTEQALDKRSIIAELTRSEHGDLSTYLPVGLQAAREDSNFYAHLVAWNHVKGQVRDSKLALPVIAIAGNGISTGAFQRNVAEWPSQMVAPLIENALAHLADLSPQIFKRAVLETTRFDKATKKSVTVAPFIETARAPKRLFRRLVTRYLRDLEANRRQFEYTAVLHRKTLHELYAHWRVPAPEWVSRILYKGVRGKPKDPTDVEIFQKIRQLHLMPLEEAAGTIVKYKIPFLVARGALGKKASETDTALALIKAMSPTELVTNTSWLTKLGIKTNPVLRAAYEEALGKAATSKKAKVVLKTTRAAEALIDDDVISGKLNALQEVQLDKTGGIDGNWLVLGDKSGSMQGAIEVATQIAAILARLVKGRVHLAFFDLEPYWVEVTGKTLEEIKSITMRVQASGGTNMACGIKMATERRLAVDGIVFISDGANHGLPVVPAYRTYCDKLSLEPTVYFYKLHGESDSFSGECASGGLDVTTYDLRHKPIDHNSLLDLALTMRVGKYTLIDEIMAMPLRTLDEVLDRTIGMPVLPQEAAVHA